MQDVSTPLKGHHKVKILVINHKKDVRACTFVQLRYQFHKPYFHASVKRGSIIRVVFFLVYRTAGDVLGILISTF